MEINVSFPGNLKVDAELHGHTVRTDQPEAKGGDGSAPAPAELFLASLATCAGIFMLWFMKERNIDPAGSGVTMTTEKGPKPGLAGLVTMDLRLPEGFPEKYEKPLMRAVDQCTVKRYLHDPPDFEVRTSR